jgi:hypothetical protein
MSRHFSNWLKAYMQYTRDSESPDAFHFWTGVSTVAGALRRRVWIDMRKFQWTPNFYIILVGPPGVAAKSTSLRNGMRLLEQVEGIKFGPQSMTWQALTQVLEESMEYTKYLDEKGEEQAIPNSSVTITVAELGTFFKTDDNVMMDVLVSMWDGQLENWGHKTKTTGQTEIKNPWLNMIGCTTPSWIQNNFPEHMIGGGLTSRIVFVYGDAKRHLVAYPDEVIKGEEYRELENKLVEDLQQIASLAGPYKLSAAARTWGRKWYETLWTSRPLHMASDRYSGYISRKQTHIHKLSIILAAAKRDEKVIEKEDLEEANELLTSVEPHMIKVFEAVGVVDEAKHVAEITAFVRVHKWLTSNDLWRMCANVMREYDFKTALRIALQGGILEIEQRGEHRGLKLKSAVPPTKH